jgi:hypothetical protein
VRDAAASARVAGWITVGAMSQPFSRVQVDGERVRGQLSSGMWVAMDVSVPLVGTLPSPGR